MLNRKKSYFIPSFLPHYENVLNFFFNNISFSEENGKWKNKSIKLLPDQERKNCKKYRVSIIEIFLKMNILEKEIMLALKIKIFQTQTEKKQNI